MLHDTYTLCLASPLPPHAHLFSRLCFSIALQEVALYRCSNDGQSLAGFQLRSKRQQSGVFHMQIFVQFQKHQQLRSEKRGKETVWGPGF